MLADSTFLDLNHLQLGHMAGNDGGQAPKLRLPSFKDVRKQNAERAQLRSNFSGWSASNAPPNGSSASSVRPAGQPVPAAQHHVVPGHASMGSASVSVPPFLADPDPNMAVAVPPRPCAGQPQVPSRHSHGPNASVRPHPAHPQPAHQARPPSAPGAYSAHVTQGNAILVNSNQRGNPVLKYLRNVNHRFADVVPDFQFNDKVRHSHPLSHPHTHSRIDHSCRCAATTISSALIPCTCPHTPASPRGSLQPSRSHAAPFLALHRPQRRTNINLPRHTARIICQTNA